MSPVNVFSLHSVDWPRAPDPGDANSIKHSLPLASLAPPSLALLHLFVGVLSVILALNARVLPRPLRTTSLLALCSLSLGGLACIYVFNYQLCVDAAQTSPLRSTNMFNCLFNVHCHLELSNIRSKFLICLNFKIFPKLFSDVPLLHPPLPFPFPSLLFTSFW